MTEDNVEMLACPTPDMWNRIHCIHYYSLCDRKINCPNAEDEDPTMCLFHSVVSIFNTGPFLPISRGRISAPFPIKNSHLFSEYHV